MKDGRRQGGRSTPKIRTSLPGSAEDSAGVGARLLVHVHHLVVWNFPTVLSGLGTGKKTQNRWRSYSELQTVKRCGSERHPHRISDASEWEY